MQQAIAPLHQLTPSHAGWSIPFSLNPKAPTLYVSTFDVFIDPCLVIERYWAWIFAVAAVLIVGFTWWRLHRILSRPQRRAVPHCRKCNYDLSGRTLDPTGASGTCPECGVALTPRAVIRGRSTACRILPLALVLGPLLVSLAVLAVLLALGMSPLPACPSRSCQALIDRFGIDAPPECSSGSSEIVELDLATGRPLRVVARRTGMVEIAAVAPGGDAILVWDVFDGSLAIISTTSGRTVRRTVVRDPAFVTAWQAVSAGPAVIGFSADASAAFVRDPIMAPNLATIRIWRWSLVDGSRTLFAELPVPADQQSLLRLVKCLSIVPGDAGERLAYFDESNVARGPRLVLAGPPPQTEFGVDCGALPSLEIGSIAVTSDGVRIYVPGSSENIVDVHERTKLALPPPAAGMVTGHVAIDSTDRWLALAIGNSAWDYTHVGIYDALNETWAGRLALPTMTNIDALAMSADARFVVARATPMSPAGPPFLLVWDASVLTAPPRAPSGPSR